MELQQKEIRLRRKRSNAWMYFAPHEDDKARCLLCNRLISLWGSAVGNFRSHLMAIHPTVELNGGLNAKKVEQTAGSELTRLEGDWEGVMPEAADTVCAVNNFVNWGPCKRKKPVTDSTPARNINTYVWMYFARHGIGYAKCNLCQKVLSSRRGGSTSSLDSHLRSKHKDTLAEIGINVPKMRNISHIVDNMGDVYQTQSAGGETTRKSNVWLFFSQCAVDKYQCEICKIVKTSRRGTTSSLNIHLLSKHTSAEIESYLSSMQASALVKARNESNPNRPTKPADSVRTIKNRSSIWKHFSPHSVNRVKCRICKNVLSIKGGSTSSLKYHLRCKHRSTEVKSNSSAMLSSSEARRKKQLDNFLLRMIALDLQPFSMVEDQGFCEFVAALQPSYQLPSRDALKNDLLPPTYTHLVEATKALLAQAEFVTLATDGWTADTAERYIAVTAHFVTRTWERKSCLLECIDDSQCHAAETLCEELERIAADWGLTGRVYAIVTDNAANMRAAVELTGWTQVPCFTNTVNLVVQNVIAAIQPIQDKVKDIVSYFLGNTAAARALQSLQQRMKCKPLKLKNDVVARWTSTYYMFQRVCEAQESLEAAIDLLDIPVPTLSHDDWILVRECCKILKPFKQLTVESSEQSVVSVSKVILLARGLKAVCNRVRSSITTMEGQQLLDTLIQSLTAQFYEVEHNDVLVKATYLDPRFKENGFTDEDALNSVTESITSEMIGLQQQVQIEQQQQQQEELQQQIDSQHYADVSDEVDVVWKAFDRRAAAESSTPVSSAAVELRLYGEEPDVDRKSDPLEWWRTREHVYPTLSQLAMRILGAVATSAPTAPSTERRSQLKPKNVQMRVFLNANLVWFR